jgi:DUF438 domain-containing protein/uncharacterized protein (DUF2249 family)
MSELINNSEKRKELLKHMIMQLHAGEAPAEARKQLVSLLTKIPYGEVVEVEQELISENILSEAEVLKFCDIHSEALDGHIDLSGMKIIPPGHPVDTFKKENQELLKVCSQLEEMYDNVTSLRTAEEIIPYFLKLKALFNSLMDVEKHYLRKENLVFPYMEKYGITGPPKVMWGKHNEIRELLKASIEVLDNPADLSPEEAASAVSFVFKPASDGVADMTMKEDQILLPMVMDKLTDLEWYEVYKQTLEIGFCLYDPDVEWKPLNIAAEEETNIDSEIVQLPSGSFTKAELQAILNTLPVDMTFVDKNEKVKYFSQGKERIFHRSRAILNRDVKLCHPPSSVHIVEQILEDFRTGKQDHAPFWIQMKDRFIFIEYYALRDENGEYLGTLEVSQDLTEKRALQGEQRILEYKQDSLEGLKASTDGQGEKPTWLVEEKIVKRLDARPIIEEGGHPLGEVLTGVGELKTGEIYELITPFLPAPLIEKVVAQGFDNWSDKKSEDHFINYFLRK